MTKNEKDISELSWQDQKDFVGFFELLLDIDKRVNADLYTK